MKKENKESEKISTKAIKSFSLPGKTELLRQMTRALITLCQHRERSTVVFVGLVHLDGGKEKKECMSKQFFTS